MNTGMKTGSSNHVLIVDDNEDIQQIFACLVQSITGQEPTLATSASEAIQEVEKAQKDGHQFNLILLDIRMPGVNGIDAAKAIRKTGFTGLIAACTVASTGTGRRESLEAGIDVYLDKKCINKSVISALLDQSK